MPATYTPIRYPGGKTKLYPLIRDIIDQNEYNDRTYCEAFAGGAGAAMKLLLMEDVSSVIINDLDRAVYCMWDCIVNHSIALCNFIDKVDVTVDSWKRFKAIYNNQGDATDKELGHAAFFLNRTNVSGILNGGVIGGVNQTGNYPINARFSKNNLKKKIRAIAKKKHSIELYQLDVEDFIDQVLKPRSNEVFCYFDPPYVQKGPGLYKSSFNEKKHRVLAQKILNSNFPWMATYDDDPLVCELYRGRLCDTLILDYSANIHGKGVEKLILSEGMQYKKPLNSSRIDSECS